MTTQEALDYLNQYRNAGNHIHREAMDMAIEVLEKQIPKTEFCDMGQGWSCQTCGALTGRHFAYCPECGHSLL